MIEVALGGGGQPDDVALAELAVVRHHAANRRGAQRQRPRLVEDDGVDPRQALEGMRPFDEDAELGGALDGRDEGGGYADTGGHAVVRDQDRGARVHAAGEGCAEPGVDERPAHLAIGEPLGEDLDVGLLFGGYLHPLDNPSDRSVETDVLDAHHHLAVLDDRRREHPVARSPLHGQGLARHGLLVD